LDPILSGADDLRLCNRSWPPYIHTLRNSEQNPVNDSECAQSIASRDHLFKKNTTLFGEASCAVNPYRITALN
jgi:hypothetical protein